jgi:hypothetical protein
MALVVSAVYFLSLSLFSAVYFLSLSLFSAVYFLSLSLLNYSSCCSYIIQAV